MQGYVQVFRRDLTRAKEKRITRSVVDAPTVKWHPCNKQAPNR